VYLALIVQVTKSRNGAASSPDGATCADLRKVSMRYQSTFLACSEGKLFFVLQSRTIRNSQHSSYDYDNAFTPKLSSVLVAGEYVFINVNVAMQSL
jgi:hypothetical protein